jgi:hypothetical protein
VRLERIPMSLLLALRRWRERRRGREQRPLRIAGLMATRDYDDECSAFAALRELSDLTIVLDDGSRQPFPLRAECDEHLRLDRAGPWNDQANRTLLMYRAFVHGCDWAVSLDDDLMLDAGFQTRDDVAREIAALAAAGLEASRFTVRELWGGLESFRVDGVWGRKSIAVLRRNWFTYPRITLRDPARRLHAPVFPANLRIRQRVDTRRIAYHVGCLTAERRRARVEKYGREDPEGRFQSDYAYMLDERGLELAPVPGEDLAALRRRWRGPGAP